MLYSDLRQSHDFSGNEELQTVFTTEEFLEVVIESWTSRNMNPLNSFQTLRVIELLGHHIYIYCVTSIVRMHVSE